MFRTCDSFSSNAVILRAGVCVCVCVRVCARARVGGLTGIINYYVNKSMIRCVCVLSTGMYSVLIYQCNVTVFQGCHVCYCWQKNVPYKIYGEVCNVTLFKI